MSQMTENNVCREIEITAEISTNANLRLDELSQMQTVRRVFSGKITFAFVLRRFLVPFLVFVFGERRVSSVLFQGQGTENTK